MQSLRILSSVIAGYEEWTPAPELSHLVACVWAARFGAAGEPHVDRVIPDGCIDLVYTDGRLIVAGPDTQSVAVEAPARTEFTGLRFRPGAAPAVLGLPASALVDQRVDAECLLGSNARVLLDAIEAQSSLRGRVAVLEAHVRSVARKRGEPDPVAQVATQRLKNGPHGRTVAALASELGMSERQLHRRFVQAVGYGPKMFERIARLQRFVAQAAQCQRIAGNEPALGRSLAQLALTSGYADQSHLTRECRALTGVTPTALVGYPVTTS